MSKKAESSAPAFPSWTFLTNQGHVLLCLAAQPEIRLRDVAARVGITERAVQRIVAELEEARYLERRRHGRRNRYEFRSALHLRHPVEGHRTIGELIDFVLRPPTVVSVLDRDSRKASSPLQTSDGVSNLGVRATIKRDTSIRSSERDQ